MPYIILDRDGVINYDSHEYIKLPEEWEPIPGSLDAIARLNQSGFKVLVATNQSGIARGFFDVATLELIHDKFTRELAAVGGTIQEIFFCPHHPLDQCECRKPKPGMLHSMHKKYAFALEETFFIGDSFVDVQAAEAAGCIPILVLTGKGRDTLENYLAHHEILNFPDLKRAVDYVLSRDKKNNV